MEKVFAKNTAKDRILRDLYGRASCVSVKQVKLSVHAQERH